MSYEIQIITIYYRRLDQACFVEDVLYQLRHIHPGQICLPSPESLPISRLIKENCYAK